MNTRTVPYSTEGYCLTVRVPVGPTHKRPYIIRPYADTVRRAALARNLSSDAGSVASWARNISSDAGSVASYAKNVSSDAKSVAS
jgi:hypothetical protein